jgi:hypothetical protein
MHYLHYNIVSTVPASMPFREIIMKLNLFEFEKRIVPPNSSNFQQDIISHVNSRDRIISEFSRIPLNSIISLHEKSYFKLDPEYQRHLKWSDSQKSKLIESLILNIPIPPVFLYEYSLSKTEVMDGIQRISAIIDFLSNKYKLKDLLFLHELNGKKFSELDEDSQNSITRRHLSAIIILNESSNNSIKEKQIKRLIFERLNTGGVKLTSQEVRHAIYPGKFLDVCIELAKEESFKKLWDIENNARGSLDRKYEELVLRFFALRSISALHTDNKNIEDLLDKYLYFANQLAEEEIDKLVYLFKTTMNTILETLGVTAFQKNSKGLKAKVLSDPIMLVFSNYVNEMAAKLIDKKEILIDKFQLIKYDAPENKNLFNGKYWSIKLLNARCDFFDELLKKCL